MTGSGIVQSARVTHYSSSVDDIAAVSPDSQRTGIIELLSKPAVEEAFVLATCNRVEAYVVTPEPAVGEAVLTEFFEAVPDETVVHCDHDASLRHLLRVAAGLESVIIGEDQIIGQIRTAYDDARCSGGIDHLLETAVTKAIRVGERARTETAINEGIVSLGSAATELITDDAGVDVESAQALVVGAGEMGRLVARNLADVGVEDLIVANRTVPHAEHVVSELDTTGRAISLEELDTVTGRVDVIVTATGSPDPLLGPDQLSDCEQVVVDLGQPRDVDPTASSLPGVSVYDLDDLESVTEATRTQRAEAAAAVDRIVDEEFERLCGQYKRKRADDVIASMYESAERIKRREVQTALSRFDGELSEEERDIVHSMADALVSQLLAPPTKSLRDAAANDDWDTIHTALQLFDPEFGPNSPDPSAFEDLEGDRQIGAYDD